MYPVSQFATDEASFRNKHPQSPRRDATANAIPGGLLKTVSYTGYFCPSILACRLRLPFQPGLTYAAHLRYLSNGRPISQMPTITQIKHVARSCGGETWISRARSRVCPLARLLGASVVGDSKLADLSWQGANFHRFYHWVLDGVL